MSWAYAVPAMEQVLTGHATFLPYLGELIPPQMRSEHPEPLPFILLAYAPDESIGAEIERARIAKAIAANRLKEIRFMSDFLPRLRPGGQEYGRATILKADRAESMIGAELLWRRRVLHRTSRPGDRRTAHSATAGTAPVPSHIAYFGGAVVLGQSGGPSSRGTHGRA
jgi:hypothetical protein